MDPCGCIRTEIHGVIDACQEHGPWTQTELDAEYFVRIRATVQGMTESYFAHGYAICCEFELFRKSDIAARAEHKVANLDNVTPFVVGIIKWDGCSDWDFTPAAHFCSRGELLELGQIMARLYDLASDLLPADLPRA